MWRYLFVLLSKEHIYAMKGIAICAVVFHNFTRLFGDLECNEFNFYDANVDYLKICLVDNPLLAVFSFWGWLGVPVFVFCSGYGLNRKYSNKIIFNKKLCIYYINHFLKLFFLLFPVYSIYVLTRIVISSDTLDFSSIVLQYLLVLNVVNPLSIAPGAYWYMGMCLQLYFLFPFLQKLSVNRLCWLSIFTIVIYYIFLYFDNSDVLIYIRHNSVGWLPLFIGGIVLSRFHEYRKPEKNKSVLQSWYRNILCLIFAVVCFHLSLHKGGWPFVEYSLLLFVLLLCPYLVHSQLFLRLGVLSPCIYILHPLIRSFLNILNLNYTNGFIAFVVLILLFIVSVAFSIIYMKFYCWINGKLLLNEKTYSSFG